MKAKYCKLTLGDGKPVYIHKEKVAYVIAEQDAQGTNSIVYFSGNKEPIRVKEFALGLKDALEDC